MTQPNTSSALDSSQKKISKENALKEIKYSLTDLLDEARAERKASTMAKQIVDQLEIQKMLKDQKKKNSGNA